MFKFAHPEYAYLLLALIPATLAFIMFMLWRKSAFKKLGEYRLVSRLMPGKSSYKHQLKFILYSLAFISLVIAVMNPLVGTRYEKVKREGVDVIIALDVSNSMLAEDVTPNRVERSKQFISRILARLKNDRVGLIVFAGKAYVQVPLTADFSAVRLFLSTVSTGMVPTQGTAIAEAIQLAMTSFVQEEEKFKSMVIITDGEDHEGDVMAAVEEATKQGIVVYTVGVGSPKGAPIPVYRNNVQVDFRRDREGNIVLTRLDEITLQQMAVKGNGKYLRLGTGTDELNEIIRAIAGMEKKEFEEVVFADYEDQFQYFLLAGLFFLILEFLISERRSRWLAEWKIFK